MNTDHLRGRTVRRSMKIATVAWLFGSVYFFSTSGAAITLFAQSLGASKFQFGLLTALPFLTALLSLPSSLYIDKTGQRKWLFLTTHYAHRLVWIAIAFLPPWLARNQNGSTFAIAAFLSLIFLNYCGQQIGGPAWVSWMADIVPERLRGRYFSRRRSWGLVTAIPAAVITGWFLDALQRGGRIADSQQTLRWCGYVFIVATVFGIIDISLHQLIPDVRATPHRQSMLRLFARPLRNKPFMWFASYVGVMGFAISFMGQFLTLYLIEKLKVTNTQTQIMLLAAPAAAQLLVLPGWGHAVDRLGKKPVLVVASLGFIPVGFAWCFMNSGAIWLGYLLGAVGAALWAGVEVANFNMVLEFVGQDETEGTSGTTYFAVNLVIGNIAGCVGGLCSGVIAQSLKDWSYDLGILGLAPISFYEVLFAMSGLIRLLAAIVFLPRIHEPEARPATEALRFMTANIYNNLFNAVFQPLKMIMRKG